VTSLQPGDASPQALAELELDPRGLATLIAPLVVRMTRRREVQNMALICAMLGSGR
jgi:hypothetical protein